MTMVSDINIVDHEVLSLVCIIWMRKVRQNSQSTVRK